VTALIQWWVLLEVLGFLALPLTFALFGPNSTYGHPFGKIFTVLVVTYVAWIGGFVAPLGAALYGALAVYAALSLVAAWLQRDALSTWLRGGGARLIACHELLWTAGFAFFAWQRSLAPDIFGAEKYMDFAFFNLLSRTDSMPPLDPWMTGKTINYYYFGYFMFASLARLSRLPAYLSYNCCVITVGALAFSLTSAVVFQLTRRWGVAVLGGAMSAVLGNLDGFLQFMQRGTVRHMDYWRSSRVVGEDGATINEFPFFSTIHGDLHPHFMVLPVSLLLLAMLLDERLFPSRPEDQPAHPYRAVLPFALITLVFGAVVAISPWELPTGLMVVFLLAGRWQPLTPLFGRDRLVLLLRTGCVVVFGYLLFLPFYSDFVAPTATPGPTDTCVGSACFKLARTSLAEFLTVFGLLLFPPTVLIAARAWKRLPGGDEWRHFVAAFAGLTVVFAVFAGNAVIPLLAALIAGALLVAYADAEGTERIGFLLVAAASVTLLACEILFLKDSYGDRLYRMNTVFKFYFQAWTLLAIASPWCFDRLLGAAWRWAPAPRVVAGCLGLLVGAAACYPLGISLDRGGSPYETLNGNAYLTREHPDDYAAIEWLRANVPDLEVILEATGNPYSYYARFSSNTGLPTVLGWANHEGLWRGHEREVQARIADVKSMYTAGGLDEIKPLLDKYEVRYVLIGDIERQDYPGAGLQKFAGLQEVFRSGHTVVYKR
jgi:YYY domain-containing protein